MPDLEAEWRDQLYKARELARMYREDNTLQLIAVRSDVNPVQHILGYLVTLDLELQRTQLALQDVMSRPTARDDVLEWAATSLEEARHYGGAYGQKQRKPTGYGNAAHHIRTLKSPIEKIELAPDGAE